jgi:hypothetical protein
MRDWWRFALRQFGRLVPQPDADCLTGIGCRVKDGNLGCSEWPAL